MVGRDRESLSLARLQRTKASYQELIKLNYEHAAENCSTCPTRGVCCTDSHFVNVHITRLEAVAIRETIARTRRLNATQKRAIYRRIRDAVKRFNLSTAGDTFKQTFSCPLYEPSIGCLVHQRAKPAPCIQHGCYSNWQDLPPTSLQARTEHRIEQLNSAAYGEAWEWLPLPVWLALVDPEFGSLELEKLARDWSTRQRKNAGRPRSTQRIRKSLPVLNRMKSA